MTDTPHDTVKAAVLRLRELGEQFEHRQIAMLFYVRCDEVQRALEEALPKPCVYEARPYPGPAPTAGHNPGYAQSGAWCQTHGWNCPANTTSAPTPKKDQVVPDTPEVIARRIVSPLRKAMRDYPYRNEFDEAERDIALEIMIARLRSGAALALALLFLLTGDAQASQIKCHATPPQVSEYVSWRTLYGRKCWYVGKPKIDRSLLYWEEEAEPIEPVLEVIEPAPGFRASLTDFEERWMGLFDHQTARDPTPIHEWRLMR